MAEIHAVTMPKWGLEMTEGTLVKWHVGEGDVVRKGQVIMEIESEKIANEVESDFDGVLGRIVVPEGDSLDVGELLAVIAEKDASHDEIEGFVRGFVSIAAGRSDGAPSEAAAPLAEAAPASPVAAVEDGASAVPPPRPVEYVGDPESVRATPTARRLARELGVDIRGLGASGSRGRVSVRDVQAALGGAGLPAGQGAPGASIRAAGPSVRATPTARRLAGVLGVNLAGVAGSGRGGRISKRDVEAASGRGGSATVNRAAAENPVTVQRLDSMRKTIARRLTESKQNIPHFYLGIDVELDRLLERRRALNQSSDVKVSVNDFIVRAAALALQHVPRVNVQYHGDELHFFERSDISVAVAIEGGLITPIVRAADRKPLPEIAAATRDLAERARAGRLKADEIQGGSLTISNLGMYGIKSFDAVINPPQGAVLAVGAGEKRVVVLNGAPAVATVMSVRMSCDHRAIDGALGAEFLGVFKALLEEPMSLVV